MKWSLHIPPSLSSQHVSPTTTGPQGPPGLIAPVTHSLHVTSFPVLSSFHLSPKVRANMVAWSRASFPSTPTTHHPEGRPWAAQEDNRAWQMSTVSILQCSWPHSQTLNCKPRLPWKDPAPLPMLLFHGLPYLPLQVMVNQHPRIFVGPEQSQEGQVNFAAFWLLCWRWGVHAGWADEPLPAQGGLPVDLQAAVTAHQEHQWGENTGTEFLTHASYKKAPDKLSAMVLDSSNQAFFL